MKILEKRDQHLDFCEAVLVVSGPTYMKCRIILKNNYDIHLNYFVTVRICISVLLVVWTFDAVELVSSAYPGYQIYFWTFVGLAFGGVKDLDEAAILADRAAEARTLGYAKA